METYLDNKFYVPKIEEFHVGFEYEVRTKKYTSSTEFTENWVPCVHGDATTGYSFILGEALLYKQDAIETIKTCICKEGVRVKCLDQEDIESFGFKLWAHKGNELGFMRNTDEEGSTWIHRIEGKIKISTTFPDTTLYLGIIKNKSELKRVLQQVGVI